MDRVDLRSSWGILGEPFLRPLSPTPPLQRNGGAASKRPMEAAAPAAGMDALRSHSRGCAPTPAWKTLRVFHSRLDAVFEVQSGARVHKLPQAPPQGYFLDGSTIPSKVTFLDGLRGGLPGTPWESGSGGAGLRAAVTGWQIRSRGRRLRLPASAEGAVEIHERAASRRRGPARAPAPGRTGTGRRSGSRGSWRGRCRSGSGPASGRRAGRRRRPRARGEPWPASGRRRARPRPPGSRRAPTSGASFGAIPCSMGCMTASTTTITSTTTNPAWPASFEGTRRQPRGTETSATASKSVWTISLMPSLTGRVVSATSRAFSGVRGCGKVKRSIRAKSCPPGRISCLARAPGWEDVHSLDGHSAEGQPIRRRVITSTWRGGSARLSFCQVMPAATLPRAARWRRTHAPRRLPPGSP